MKVLELDLDSPPSGLGPTVVTIGNFDGVHLGHRKIVSLTVAAARARGVRSVVLTFEPHPVTVLHPGADFRRLKTLDQRVAELRELGVDVVALVRFDATLSATRPETFARRILCEVLAAVAVRVGPGFRFGHKRTGDFAQLAELGSRLGFQTHAVAPVSRGGRPISSTRIREAIQRGAVGEARRLLGRPFAIGGVVVRGEGRGRKLGFATANLQTRNELVPGAAVYATLARVGERLYRGATFIGAAATFEATAVAIETHLLDASPEDRYGLPMSLEFHRRLRSPGRFSSVDALSRRIEQDLARVRQIVPKKG